MYVLVSECHNRESTDTGSSLVSLIKRRHVRDSLALGAADKPTTKRSKVAHPANGTDHVERSSSLECSLDDRVEGVAACALHIRRSSGVLEHQSALVTHDPWIAAMTAQWTLKRLGSSRNCESFGILNEEYVER